MVPPTKKMKQKNRVNKSSEIQSNNVTQEEEKDQKLGMVARELLHVPLTFRVYFVTAAIYVPLNKCRSCDILP
jgi:uncharacterized membrane-anchored protein